MKLIVGSHRKSEAVLWKFFCAGKRSDNCQRRLDDPKREKCSLTNVKTTVQKGDRIIAENAQIEGLDDANEKK